MDEFDFTSDKQQHHPNSAKSALFWVVLLCTAILLWKVMNNQGKSDALTLSYSEFQDQIAADNVVRVTIHHETQVRGKLKDGRTFVTTIPPTDPSIFPLLREHAVEIDVRSETGSPVYLTILLNLSPFLLLLAFWYFMMRQMKDRAKQTGHSL